MYARRGLVVRLLYLALALLWWVCTGFGWWYRRRAVVLCYHGVLNAQRERFARQVALIRRRVRPVGDLADAEAPSHAPVVWLTFDDAFANLLDNALPALRANDASATVFAVTGNLGQPPNWRMPSDHPERHERTMSGAEYRDAVAAGAFQPGAHTVSHPRLPELNDQALQQELADSRMALEQLTDQAVVDLALPYGEFDERVLHAAHRSGYLRTFTLREQLVSDPAARVMGRFTMTPDAWMIEFLLTCAGGYAWLGPYRTLLRRSRQALAPRGQTLTAGERA